MRHLLLFCLIFICLTCRKQVPAEPIILRAYPYLGNELHIRNGCFVSEKSQSGWQRFYFFYRNGVYLTGSFRTSQEYPTLTDYLDHFAETVAQRRNNRDHWGVFEVNGPRLFMQQKLDEQFFKNPIYTRDARIDSTHVFRVVEVFDGGHYEKRNQRHEFFAYPNKPDSTNVVVVY